MYFLPFSGFKKMAFLHICREDIMSEKRLTLFPEDPFVLLPERAEFVQKLVESGFWEPNPRDNQQFVLGRIFRELLEDSYEGIEYYQIPVWIEIFDEPRLQAGADLQNLQSVKTPHGKEIGDLDTAYELMAALRANPDAVWQDSRQTFLIHELDFDHFLAFGNHFLHIGIYLKPTELFLQLVRERLGISYRFANYWLMENSIF